MSNETNKTAINEDTFSEKDGGEMTTLEENEVKALDQLLKDVPDEKTKKGIESFFLGFKVSHQGPIPAPDALAKYNEISPALVDRIVGMAEKEQLHRHDMNKELIAIQKKEQENASVLKTKQLEGELKEAMRGQIFALTFVCLALGLGFFAIMSGYQLGGAILGAIGIATIVASFIRGRFSSASNVEKTSSNEIEEQEE